jgi:hypothetical protein
MKNKPFSSPLRAHIALIRSLRRARKTWQEIAQVLEREHGLKASYKTIQAFFKRVVARDTLPLGFEPDQPKPQPPPARPPEEADDIYEQARQRMLSKQQQPAIPPLNIQPETKL